MRLRRVGLQLQPTVPMCGEKPAAQRAREGECGSEWSWAFLQGPIFKSRREAPVIFPCAPGSAGIAMRATSASSATSATTQGLDQDCLCPCMHREAMQHIQPSVGEVTLPGLQLGQLFPLSGARLGWLESSLCRWGNHAGSAYSARRADGIGPIGRCGLETRAALEMELSSRR